MKLYIETSVWSRLFDFQVSMEQETTRKLLESSRRKHELFISALVIRELNATQEPSLRENFLGAVQGADPELLIPGPTIAEVSEKIIDLGILTKRSENDSIHIAYAVVHGMDALVSWDVGDIVRPKTRRGISALCRHMGYREVDLVTPEEI